jgi:hypothetical protein
MNPTGRKIFSLFLVLSLTTLNCSPFIKKRTQIISEQKQEFLPREDVETLEPGTRIVVILNSGAKRRGRYYGLFYSFAEEYTKDYTKNRELVRDAINLPALEESITLITERGSRYECEFIGFDHRHLIIRWPGKKKIITVSLKIIKEIVVSKEDIIEAGKVSNLIFTGKIIPLSSSGIVLEKERGRTQILWKDINQIKKKTEGRSSYIVLLVLGTIVVVIVLVKIAINEINKSLEETCSVSAVTRNSPMYSYLGTIREFRDKYLLPNEFGRGLVRLYYKYSPYAANIIKKHKLLKIAVRTKLIPLIAFCYSMVHLGPIMTGAILLFIFMLPFFLAMFHRRKLRQVR